MSQLEKLGKLLWGMARGELVVGDDDEKVVTTDERATPVEGTGTVTVQAASCDKCDGEGLVLRGGQAVPCPGTGASPCPFAAAARR